MIDHRPIGRQIPININRPGQTDPVDATLKPLIEHGIDHRAINPVPGIADRSWMLEAQ